jgi:Putative peptidoglycan binding domain/Protein of unknown function (DUF1236)
MKRNTRMNKKSQLLSSAGVALLLTFSTAYAQGNKDEHQQKPQAAAQDQSKSGQAAQEKSSDHNRIEKSAQQNKNENRSTTGQASPEQKSGAQQHEMNRNLAESGQKIEPQQKKASGKANSQKNATKQPSRTEKPSTTGQASPSSSGSTSPSSTTKAQPNVTQPSSSNTANKAAQPSNQQAQPSGSNTQASGSQPTGRTQQAQGVQLDPQQQTKVADAVFSSNVPRLNSVDFSVDVGTVVPSHVHLVPVPRTLVDIYPEWREDEVFVVRDEIVIVDHSRKIVAVVPAGGHRASVGSSTTVVENMSPAEIREIQTVLIQKGFYHGHADGRWGPKMREALITFQRREGLQATGQIDPRTVSSLGLSDKIQANGAQGQPNASSAATTGSPSMSGPNSAPSTSGRNNTPSASGQNNASRSRSSSATSGQASRKADQTRSNANQTQSMAPNAGSQPSKNSTTGQGSPNMQKPDHNRDKHKNEAK